MKRALLDLAEAVSSFLAIVVFLAFVFYGSAGISAAVIAWRLGQ